MALSAGLVAAVTGASSGGSGAEFVPAIENTPRSGAAGTHAAAEPLAVLLLGPTGSGKTALSLALGEQFGGEIVSCDSVAVYRGMDLGTAKPTKEERARLPHHLIDVADPDEVFTAGEYSRRARGALREIAGRGRLPIVTGGTGLYLRALTEGLFAGPVRQRAGARSADRLPAAADWTESAAAGASGPRRLV